jgi:hypothetical protein
MSKWKLNIFVFTEDLWSIKQQDYGYINNYTLPIDRKVRDYTLCADKATTDADATDTDSGKAIAKMSEQEHIFYFLCGIPSNDKWTVFLELMMDRDATITATTNVSVAKLVNLDVSTERVNGIAPEAVFFPKLGGEGGGTGGKAGKDGKSPMRVKRDHTDNWKEKDLRKCTHWQEPGHITENCLSNQGGDPPMAADTVATASTEAWATSTLTTLIQNHWIVASSSVSTGDWFID